MHPIVVIAASAGGLDPLRRIVAALPIPCHASIFVVLHIGNRPSYLPSILARNGLPAEFARDGGLIEAGHVYTAPPDRHMLLESGRIRLSDGPKIHFTRPAADPLFISAADAYGEHVIGVVLSGGDGDGASGLKAIKAGGGRALVQHPDQAAASSMPRAAITADDPEVYLLQELIAQVAAFCHGS
jgi:two-component system, chemotaxis family, protein-glutamate methylesterase/glutaminase